MCFCSGPLANKIGSYGNAGRAFSTVPPSDDAGSMLSFGLDIYVQIDPVGSYKGGINAGGVGYRGLPIYNQVFAGLGLRVAPTERLRFYGQVGLGSGGYAPTLIDTGSGLMLYPKLAAEFLIKNNLGVSLTSGFSFALDGTAKNYTLGVALNRHFGGVQAGGAAGRYEGYRFSLSHETTAQP